jgi:hypothetical protein
MPSGGNGMKIGSMLSAFLFAAVFALGSAASLAQTDVALSLYGAFTPSTNSDIIRQSPSNAAGGLFELRHIVKPWVGYEGTYSFNRANQSYVPLSFACPVSGVLPCSAPLTAKVKADANEVTADWIASVKLANLRPFALLGGGYLFNVPTGGQLATNKADKVVFVYGAGLDWGLLPRIGLRFQYRGNLYKAPDVSQIYTSSGKFTQTAEPMIGIYFRL